LYAHSDTWKNFQYVSSELGYWTDNTFLTLFSQFFLLVVREVGFLEETASARIAL
jgi:hypothetical protein